MIRRLPIWLLLFASTSLWAIAQTGENEIQSQYERYEAYRKQLERLTTLRDNFKSYEAQSDDRKVAVRKLDEELHHLSPKRQARYWSVLDRYADWLDQLKKRNPAAFQAIKNAPDAATRLALIKTERDGEWIQAQPKVHRETWAKLQGDARADFVANLRKDERQKHLQWQIAARFWNELESKQFLPCRLSDFGHRAKGKGKDKDAKSKDKEVNKVQDYVTNYLMPFLSPAEKQQLEAAEGRWPDYPQALVELARKRPSALPPLKNNEEYLPKSFRELPRPIQERIEAKKGFGPKSKLKDLRADENSPGFAGQAVKIGTNGGSLPFEYEFWPSHFKGLLKPMQAFVTVQLIPKLSTKDKIDFEEASGRWPYYPKKIQELAKKHNLHPPWHILPEADVWHWDRYRFDRQKEPTAEKAKEDAEL